MKIDLIPLHQIKPYDKNAKKHPIAQLEKLTKAIKKYGFKQPIVLDKNNIIIAGHGRYEAAAVLGMEKIPCIIANDLNDDEVKAYRIADNKLAETGWDFDVLRGELEILKSMDFNLELLGFEASDLKNIMGFIDNNPEECNQNLKDSTEFIILINCISEHEQQKLYEEFSDRGLKCKLIM